MRQSMWKIKWAWKISLAGFPLILEYFEGFHGFRTVLDAHREGLVLGSAYRGKSLMQSYHGVRHGSQALNVYDFIRWYLSACLHLWLPKEQVEDGGASDHHQELDWGRRPSQVIVLAETSLYRTWGWDLSGNHRAKLGQGAMINRTISHGEAPSQLHTKGTL